MVRARDEAEEGTWVFTDGTVIVYFGTGWQAYGGVSEICARFRPAPWDIDCGQKFKYICMTPSVPGKTKLKTSIVSFRCVHGERVILSHQLINYQQKYFSVNYSFVQNSVCLKKFPTLCSQIQHGKIPINHVGNVGSIYPG